MAQTTEMTVAFNGTPAVVHYWADGNGQRYKGYATSLRQLQKELYEFFGVPDLDLYCITNKRLHALTSDSQIRRAIRASGGNSLLITAYGRHYNYNMGESSVESLLTLPWPQGPSSRTILEYFGGHNYECRYCKRSQVSGVRYKYVGTTSCYNICDTCYARLDSRKKRNCHARVMPWRSDVPISPLPKELDSIYHLQYLLVKLGYLELSNSGSISLSKTERAVGRFKKDHHIYSHDMTEYDIQTARKLAQVVRKHRAEGYKYL